MMKAIAAAFARLWQGTLGTLYWTEQLIKWPFSVVFGNGSGALPRPEFKPDITANELLDEFNAARQRQTAVHDLNRDGIATVIKYADGSEAARETMDLSTIKADARTTLLTMDENELKALSKAGHGKVRKWLEGKDHSIFGVPSITAAYEIQNQRIMMPAEQVLARVRTRLKQLEASPSFKLAR